MKYNKEVINDFSEIIKNCKYIISELNIKGYFDGEGIFCGINKITEKNIEISVIVKYGWPISNEYKILSIPTQTIYDNEKIEECISNTI